MGLSTAAVPDLEGAGTTSSHVLSYCFQRDGRTQFMLELRRGDLQNLKLNKISSFQVTSYILHTMTHQKNRDTCAVEYNSHANKHYLT